MLKYPDQVPYYVKGIYQGKYTLKQAAESTGYTQRWLFELKKKYIKEGDAAFIHGNIGKPAHNKISEETRQKIGALYGSDLYKDINFSYFREVLEEEENIKVSLTSLKKILSEYGYISPEAHKVKDKPAYHRLRVRRANEGDLIQIDGTPYPWFYKFGLENNYCLTGSIDDASGKITGLYMTDNECLYGYIAILRQTIEKYGVPRQMYSDRAGIFVHIRKNQNECKLTVTDQLAGETKFKTQWQRILEELGIHQVLASTPQAKGRVERMWRTLQARLPTEFAKHNIKTVEEANRFLPKYIEKFNKQFGRSPAKTYSFYRPKPDPVTLQKILCAKFKRKVVSGGCLSFKNVIMDIPDLRKRIKETVFCISEQDLFCLVDNEIFNIRILEAELAPTTSVSMATQSIIYDYMYSYAKDKSY